MKRILLPLLMILGCTACAQAAAPATQPVVPHSVMLDGHHFSVELATTEAMRARGLMQRTHLPADHGMLFVFARQAPQTFWMKDTLIPLDILFFDKDRKLVAMQLDAQPCKADPCSLLPSNKPAKYVLELRAGTAVKIGAGTGDVLTIKGRVGNVQP